MTDFLIISGFALILAVLIAIHRSTMILIAQLLEEIDARVAGAIKSVVEDLQLEGVEPPTAIQQFIMGIVAQKMEAVNAPLSSRNLKGQFSPVIEMNEDSS